MSRSTFLTSLVSGLGHHIDDNFFDHSNHVDDLNDIYYVHDNHHLCHDNGDCYAVCHDHTGHSYTDCYGDTVTHHHRLDSYSNDDSDSHSEPHDDCYEHSKRHPVAHDNCDKHAECHTIADDNGHCYSEPNNDCYPNTVSHDNRY